MFQGTFFAPGRDDQFIPLLKGMFPRAVQRECQDNPTLRGYQELVLPTQEEAKELQIAANTLSRLLEVLTYNDSKTITDKRAERLRRFVRRNIA